MRKIIISTVVFLTACLSLAGCERERPPTQLSDQRFSGVFVHRVGGGSTAFSEYHFDETNRARHIIYVNSSRTSHEIEIQLGTDLRRNQFRYRLRALDGGWTTWLEWIEFRFSDDGQELRVREAAGIWSTALQDRSPWTIYAREER